MKRYILLFSCLLTYCHSMAQHNPNYIGDSVYCIVVNCFGEKNEEPQTHTLLIPTDYIVKFDISRLSDFERKIHEDYYTISFFPLYLIEMAKFSFPDSSLQFQSSIYYNNMSKWITYNSNCLTDTITMDNGQLFISIALLHGQIQYDGTGHFPILIKTIQSIIPISMADLVQSGKMAIMPYNTD